MPRVFATPAGIAAMGKRNRSIRMHEALGRNLKVPSVYIFNVSANAFPNRDHAGRRYTIPACKPGEAHSAALEIPGLVYSEIDLADGGNTMGTIPNPGMGGVVELDGAQTYVAGVADDIIGLKSSSPGIGLYTTSLEWQGVFVTTNPVPTKAELDLANLKLRQRMELIYAAGAELVQAGAAVKPGDRVLYNEAAEVLGRKPFWGSIEHTRASCPECHEEIIAGANFCKHCQQAIDPASVAARAKKRAKDAAKLLAEDEATA